MEGLASNPYGIIGGRNMRGNRLSGLYASSTGTKICTVAGISITSLVFVVVHLHQAWASGLVLVLIFVIAIMAGYLAYSTKSLLPGIFAHVTLDIINFSYWWSDVIGTFERKPISMTGVDNHFIITVMVVLLSTILFIVAIRKLLKLKMKDSADFILRPNMSKSAIMKT